MKTTVLSTIAAPFLQPIGVPHWLEDDSTKKYFTSIVSIFMFADLPHNQLTLSQVHTIRLLIKPTVLTQNPTNRNR